MDIKCVKCGEPWDCFGIAHDMKAWEILLFRAGVGCPGCKGVSNGWEPKSITDIENGDDDPADRLYVWEEAQENKTKWKRPDDKIFWTCESCGVQVIGNCDFSETHEDYLEYHISNPQYHYPHRFDNIDISHKPAHTFGRESHVCELCLSSCEKCGKEICEHLEYGDVYDDGWCAELENYSVGMKKILFCVDCIESTCSYCNSFAEDCVCYYCSRCGETSKNCDECKCECETCKCDKNNSCVFDNEEICTESCEFKKCSSR